MNRETTLSNEDLRNLAEDDAITDEPMEREDHTPPTDQTVLSDSDLLDKLSDLVVRVGRVEIVNVPNDLTARLALRKSLARL